MKKNRYLILLIVMLLGVALLSGCGRKKEPDFAIFLALTEMTAEDVLAVPPDDLTLSDTAVLTMEDVVSYDPGAYELTLTEDAVGRIRQMGVPMGGLPFVVVAQGERVYTGAFWTPVSSLSYPGTAAMLSLEEDAVTLRFDLGYPASPELFEGVDLRNDERILKAFSKAEKLNETE
jgi:hypothetical protein